MSGPFRVSAETLAMIGIASTKVASEIMMVVTNIGSKLNSEHTEDGDVPAYIPQEMKWFAHVEMAISDEMILLWRVAAILLAPDHEWDVSLIIPSESQRNLIQYSLL